MELPVIYEDFNPSIEVKGMIIIFKEKELGMRIETKYNIEDRVWVVYECQKEVSVYDTVIEEVCYNGIESYYFGKEGVDIYEKNMVAYDDKKGLAELIERIMNEIHTREELER